MHARCLPLALACLASMFAPVAADERLVPWLKRIDEAQPVAAESKKDLLITFTGHGWCHYCELLDRAVFKQQEFAARAPQTFVLVEIDFATEEEAPVDAAEEQLRKLYAKWKKEYLVSGVPVVVLADAAGKPYAYLSYYDGITAKEFVARSQKAQAARVLRDKHLADADTATNDLERAGKLHLAMQAITAWLGTKEERGADPLLTHYADLVAEIQRLDADNAGGMREIYDQRIATRDAWVRSEAIFAELDKFRSNKDYAGAIAYVEKILPTVTEVAMRRRIEHARQVYLEWDGRNESALENSRRLQKTEDAGSTEYEWLVGREAHNLAYTRRWDEFLDLWRRRMEDSAGRPAARRKLLMQRAQLMFKTADVTQSIVASRELRQAVPLFSDDWQTATFLLGYELNRQGDYKPAIQAYRELIAYWRLAGEAVGAHILLSIAEAQFADGQLAEANRSLTAAEVALANSIDTSKPMEFQRRRMAALKETIRRAAESKS
jgi:thioredoxin-related protein